MIFGIDEHVTNIFRLMPSGVAYYAMVGGGCIRAFYDGTTVKDYDLFFNGYGDWEQAVAAFRADPAFTETTKPNEAMYPTFVGPDGVPFNLIGFRFHSTLKELAESFDFLCCGFAAWLASEEQLVIHAVPGAQEDAESLTLNFQNHQHIARVLRRAERYTSQYGYRISDQFEVELDICRGLPVDTSAGGY